MFDEVIEPCSLGILGYQPECGSNFDVLMFKCNVEIKTYSCVAQGRAGKVLSRASRRDKLYVAQNDWYDKADQLLSYTIALS